MSPEDAVEVILKGKKYATCPHCVSGWMLTVHDSYEDSDNKKGCLVCYKTRKIINPEYEAACKLLKLEVPDDPGDAQRRILNYVQRNVKQAMMKNIGFGVNYGASSKAVGNFKFTPVTANYLTQAAQAALTDMKLWDKLKKE